VSSPTSRSLDLLRKSCFIAEPCERWIPGANVRRDLFHVGDIFAVNEARKELWLVQACTLADLAARRKKALEQPQLKAFLLAGGRLCTFLARPDRINVQAGELLCNPPACRISNSLETLTCRGKPERAGPGMQGIQPRGFAMRWR
jgi:hypothetical protein